MLKETYQELEALHLISNYECSREEYLTTDHNRQAYGNIESTNSTLKFGIYPAEEELDLEEIKLRLALKQATNIRTIRDIIVFFTTISVITFILYLILFLMK